MTAEPPLRDMKPTRTHQFVAGFALALGLLASVALLNWRQTGRMLETAALVARTHEEQANLTRLLSLVQDIETGERGFVVTGEPVFLESFEAGLSAVVEQERRLGQLILSDEQKANLRALESLIAQRIAVSRRDVELRRNAGFEAARQAVASGMGRAVMDAVRAQVARMDVAQQTLLDQRSAAALRGASNTVLLTISVTGLSAALLIAVFALVMRENRLRQQAQVQLDRFFTLSLDMLCIAGMNGYFKRLNPAFNQTLGYTTDELLARPFLDFVHPDDRAATLAEMEKLSRGVPTISFENRYQCQDGSWRWLSWKTQPVAEEGLLYATARDITDRRRIEEHLTEVVDQLRAFKTALDEHAIVAITDVRGTITYVNDKFCAISKYARGELIGQDHRLVNSGHHPKAFIRDLWQTISSGRVWQGEIKNRAKDGTFYWVATTIVPFFNEHGKPVQYVAIRADITERKQDEENISQLNADLQVGAAQLAESNKELESFSYSVSHDLRAPLRHVHGYIEMLQRDTASQLSEKAQRYVETITEASVEMGQLIDDLLAFSRMGRTEMRESYVDLNALVQDTIRGLEMTTTGRNIAWQVTPLPAVAGDPSMLKQVLANLIENAVKYSRQRDPARIEIGCAGEEEGRVVLFVRDNGAGFDMQYAHKLFGVFQRLHRPEEFEGSGIGLATVRRIVARHGGRVWAEGALDQGATVYVTLKRSASA